MDRSKLSHMISTTRLLPHFSSTNVDAIKSCLFDQLGIETESQFLCIVLNSVYKTLSVESLSIIRCKAIEIAENQLITYCTPTRNTMTQHQSNITVYKYIEQQHNNGFCQLHGDIIDYFGTFLNKKQSIEFGYLNKQLFLETQKQSYLLKRCKDNIFKFNSNKCDKMLIGKNDMFNCTFPRLLTLDLKSHHFCMVPKMPYFSNFFRRLSVLNCNSLASLYCVPLKYAFVKHKNCYPDSESCDNFDGFKVVSALVSNERLIPAAIKQVDIICEKFDRLILDHSNSPDKIRGIKQFTFKSFGMVAQKNINNCMNLLAKRILMRFGSISKSIDLRMTELTFDNISEIKKFFHCDLRHIYFDGFSPIIIKIDRHVKQNISHENHMHVASLESIAFDTRRARPNVPSCIDTLNEFDKLCIRRNVKRYTLHWRPPFVTGRDFVGQIVPLDIGSDVNVFDTIFFQDYDKHPLLESIIIKFEDDQYLLALARLLIYFQQHYTQLFVDRKLYLTHFQTIEIHIHSIWMLEDELQRIPQVTSNPELFEQERNKEYIVDDKMIEIKSDELKQGIASFGIIFENVFYCLQQMKKKSCKIAFRFE